MSEIVLLIGALEFKGWQSVEVTKSIDAPVHSFSLDVTEQWTEAEDSRPISPGDACELFIDNILIITGYVDAVDPVYNATSHSISVVGRSKLADINDCPLNAQTFKGEHSIEAIAKSVCDPFGIKVVQTITGLATFKDQELEYGQTGLDLLNDLAKLRGLRIFGGSDGTLIFGRASTERIETPLVLGENIKDAGGSFNNEQRFSKYTIVSSVPGTDLGFGKATVSEAVATDEEITRYRPFFGQTEIPGTLGDCQDRANWQLNTRIGKAKKVDYNLQGWKHDAGIWDFNKLITVQDAYQRFFDAELLISTVKYRLSSAGEITTLTIVPPAAYKIEPAQIPPKKVGF